MTVTRKFSTDGVRPSETNAGKGRGQQSPAETSSKDPQNPVNGPGLDNGLEDRKNLQMRI
jgi:hypothetical protein